MDRHALSVLEFDAIRERVAEACDSPVGRAVAGALEPHHDIDTVRLCLLQTDEARALLDAGVAPPLAGVVDVCAMLDEAREQNRPLEPSELLDLAHTCDRSRDIKRFLSEQRVETPELTALANKFLDNGHVTERILKSVESPGVVADAASEKLWELRRAIRTTEDEVNAKLHDILQREPVRQAVPTGNFTIRSGRYVLGVKFDMKGRVPGILHDRSQTGSTAFIEPAEIVPITNRLRELKGDQTKEENRILWELTRLALDARNALLHTVNLLAWFDFTTAKARYSKAHGMRSPSISEDGRLRLSTARHPLLVEAAARTGDEVVPMDVRLREGFRILVITGPNTGGKTVTLKTVGLLQAMFQSGMHLPVGEGSRLPIFRNVFADIGDEQSISQSLSTFSGHIRNVASILEKAGRSTLVLLDELGAGTDPAEGAALGRAILEELKDRKAACIVTTHLGSLKEFAFAHPEVENASVEFDAESMRPTYKLLIGQPGNSNALTIAQRHGIDATVVERARAALEEGADQEEKKEVIDQLLESRRAVEDVRARSEKHLNRSKNLQKAAEEKQRHLEKRERRLSREAEDIVDESLRGLVADVDPLLRELQNVPKALKPAVEKLADRIRHARRETSVGKRRREFIAGLKKQDEIWVPRLGQVCTIRKFNRGEELITVKVGNMTMEIAYDDVSWLMPERP